MSGDLESDPFFKAFLDRREDGTSPIVTSSHGNLDDDNSYDNQESIRSTIAVPYRTSGSKYLDNYEQGSRTLPIKSKRNKKSRGGKRKKGTRKSQNKGGKRKGKRKNTAKKSKNKDGLGITDDLFQDQPMREKKPSYGLSSSSEDMFESASKKFGKEYVLGGSKNSKNKPYLSIPRDKVGNEVGISMRMSNSIDPDDSAVSNNKYNISNSDDSTALKDSIDDMGFSEDDMDISIIDMDRDKVDLDSIGIGKDRRNYYANHSDDDLTGAIRKTSGFGMTGSSKPSSSFKNGTLISSDPKISNSSGSSLLNDSNKDDSSFDFMNPQLSQINDGGEDYINESEIINPHEDNNNISLNNNNNKSKLSVISDSINPKQEEKIRKLEEDLENERDIQKEQREEIEELKLKLESAASNNNNNNKVNEELEELQLLVTSLEDQKEGFSVQLKDAQEELENVKLELEEKSESLLSLRSTISVIQTEKQDLEDSYEELSGKNKILVSEIEELKENKNKNNNVNTTSSISIVNSDLKIKNLELEIEEEREMRNELVESNKKINEDLETLNGKYKRIDILLSEREKKIQALETENELLQNDISIFQSKSKKDVEKNDDENVEMKNLEKMFNTAEKDNQKLREKLKKFEKEEKEENEKEETEVRFLKQENTELQETIQILTNEKEKFSEYAVKLTRLEQEKDSMSRAFEEEKAEWGIEKTKMKKRIEFFESSQELLKKKNIEIDALKKEINDLKSHPNKGNDDVIEDLLRKNEEMKKKMNENVRLSTIIKESVKEQKNENVQEVERLKRELANVQEKAKESLRTLKQEFLITKANNEKRMEEIKKKKNLSGKKNNSNIVNSRKVKNLMLEKKKLEDEINSRDQEIGKLKEQIESEKNVSRMGKRKNVKLEKRISKLKISGVNTKKKEDDILRVTQKYEDRLFMMEKDNQRMIQEMRLNHERELNRRESEIKNLPHDEKSRRLLVKVEELMNRLAVFESNQRVQNMKHSQEKEELKAQSEVEVNRVRREYNKILQNKTNQVKHFKLVLDQIMEDISRFKKVKDFELSQISLVQKSRLQIK